MDYDAFDAFDDEEGEQAPAKQATAKQARAPPTQQPDASPAKKQRPDAAPAAPAQQPPPPAATQAGDASAQPEQQQQQLESTGKACKHEVAMPPGQSPDPSMIALDVPDGRVPARTYKFELDPFQKAAVACIERDESVLVSAHTSAGKTVCAEYAIATSLRETQRVLYTSPIKALSNQKYRELKEEVRDSPRKPRASPRSPARRSDWPMRAANRRISRVSPRVSVWRCRPDDGRCDDRCRLVLPRDDDGDPTLDALPRLGGDARGQVGHL